jgi:hypothetical protein
MRKSNFLSYSIVDRIKPHFERLEADPLADKNVLQWLDRIVQFETHIPSSDRSLSAKAGVSSVTAAGLELCEVEEGSSKEIKCSTRSIVLQTDT